MHVHKFLKTPDPTYIPIEPAAIKQYIAHARELEPAVPPSLSSYIVEAYVALRSQDFSYGGGRVNYGPQKGNDQTAMTARQLLSILRLSQSLARLRLSNLVSQEDVDEAIRLIHSSKASLFDDGPTGAQEDPTSAIFSILRDFSAQHKTKSISYIQAEAMAIKKGFSISQFKNTLKEYEVLQVIHLDATGENIFFDH